MKQFETVRIQKPKSSVFDLSHENKLTMDMAKLVPVFLQETIPGDKFRVNTECLLRFQPLLAPIMHRVNVYVHFFFVPNRLIWDDWKDFITGGKLGTLEPNHPKLTGTGNEAVEAFGLNSLGDYLGIPVKNYVADGEQITPVSQLPFRAYQLIYNEYYRDQNMEDEIVIPKGSLDYVVSSEFGQRLHLIRTRSWEKDYFTSCLPTAQRGAAVKLPLIGTVDVSGHALFKKESDGTNPDAGNTKFLGASDRLSDANSNLLEVVGGLTGELDEATATTISELRTAFSLQRWMEKMMRGGARYIEQIKMMFGVTSSDARLQRPEYLGGGKLPVAISEVLQTSETNTTAQGNMSGHAVSAGMATGFSKFFEEHGFVIGIISVLPRTAYMQGLPRIFSKFDRFDYFWPDFAHIGEQPVFNRELFVSNDDNDEETFGYQPRYSEYRYMYDHVHGDFRDTLKFWHMAREFNELPLLGKNFTMANPTTRIYPVEDLRFKKLIVQLYFNFRAIRPIPKFGDPV